MRFATISHVMIVFGCPICRTKLSATESQVGAAVRCPQCQTTLKVPLPEMATAGGVAGNSTHPVKRPAAKTGAAASFFKAAGGGGSGKHYGFNCAYCSSRLEATDAMAASEGQCPTCGSTITIPIQDRYGRLIDPITRKIIKQDPHPVHAYAAAGDRAPRIFRQKDGKQIIRCTRCSAVSPINANNCKACGMPFTMEGTTVQAGGTSNGFCVASLVLGIISIPTFCSIITPLLAIVFGCIGYSQTKKAESESSGKGMAIAGIICGSIGGALAFYHYVL
jgi:predicted Zn finger-like uncharacterized protein